MEILSIVVNIMIRKIKLHKLYNLVLSNNIAGNIIDETCMEDYNAILIAQPDLPFTEHIKLVKEKEYFSKEVSIIIDEADYFLKNTFKVFGSDWIRWDENNEMAWHRDFLSNYCWDKTSYYLKIDKQIRSSLTSSQIEGHDPKVVWELNRFYFIFGLYFAYVYTDEKKYLNGIKTHILNWIHQNSPYYGINWTSPMEVSIRLINWSLVVYALKNEIMVDKNFARFYYKSIAEHLIFIRNNLENIITKNNHYISNLCSIYIISLLFPVFKKNRTWLKWSEKRLDKELRTQIYNDGGTYEGSTAYHGFISELFFLPYFLNKQITGNKWPNRYKKILQLMFKFVVNVTKPNGRIIQFGDNDSGRVFKLFNHDSLDYRHLLSLGYGMFSDLSFCVTQFKSALIGHIFFGEKIYHSYMENTQSLFTIKSKDFSDSGIYVLRNSNFYGAISCIPNGNFGKSIHTHNDKLSFELTYKKDDIIVDPGTYIYTSNPIKRNLFRSTCYHNTVKENNFEQNSFRSSLFELSDDAKCKITKFNNYKLECQHNGFEKKGGAIHFRKYFLGDTNFIIEDYLDSNLPLKAYLHFAIGIQVKRNGNSNQFFLLKNNQNLLELNLKDAKNIVIEDYEYAPGYRTNILCKKMIIEFSKSIQFIFNAN